MAAIRHAIEIIYIPLDPRCEFNGRLPHRFLEDESGRVESLWSHHFCPSITAWCRRSLKIKSNFEFGLSNICNEFSQRTECVKVRLYKEQQQETTRPARTARQKLVSPPWRNRRTESSYSLKLTRLSAIPERSRRSQQFCSAEIPDLEEAKLRKLQEMCTMIINPSNLLDPTDDAKQQHGDDDTILASSSFSSDDTDETSTSVRLSPDAPNGDRLVPASCAICFCNYSIGDSIMHSSNQSCRHAFHAKCLTSWFERNPRNKSCPCCRQLFWTKPVLSN